MDDISETRSTVFILFRFHQVSIVDNKFFKTGNREVAFLFTSLQIHGVIAMGFMNHLFFNIISPSTSIKVASPRWAQINDFPR